MGLLQWRLLPLPLTLVLRLPLRLRLRLHHCSQHFVKCYSSRLHCAPRTTATVPAPVAATVIEVVRRSLQFDDANPVTPLPLSLVMSLRMSTPPLVARKLAAAVELQSWLVQ
tara:strand:+ start:2289 stop:2624 length:336 start_codon:yes stop_codon:yes gene_type:complete